MSAESIGAVLAAHRQQFRPETGDSDCACGDWRGPFTMVMAEWSYAAHVEAAVVAWLRERLASAEVREAVSRSLAVHADELGCQCPDCCAEAALAAVADVVLEVSE